jgi:hypothetical protein
MADLSELAFMQWLLEQGHLRPKPLPNGRWAALLPLMFTTAIVTGKIGDKFGYDDRWCYENKALAEAALNIWGGTGEPEGWNRHPTSGRRRVGGDASKEWVNY